MNVRVILDQHLEKTRNKATYAYLTAHGVHVAWAPKSMTYHQKTLTIDNATSAVMTLNMVSADYAGTRDFAVIDTSPSDVAAIVATFNTDFAGTGRASLPRTGPTWCGRQPTPRTSSCPSSVPPPGRWPSRTRKWATPKVTSALIAAAHRGVNVTITMTAQKLLGLRLRHAGAGGRARPHLRQ